MRPLFSYYGGKQRLAAAIVAWLPPHTVYVEPYAGGAAVLFAKPTPQVSNTNHYREVLNDHNERLITVYRVAQDPVQRHALLDRLQYTPFSRAAWQRSKDILATWPQHDPVSQAWAVLVKLHQSFGNDMHGGWATAVYGRNHAATWGRWRHRLPELCARLDGVYLECDEALSVIRRWDSPQTVFNCDPPYVGTDQGHYRGFRAGDLQQLVEVLTACQGSFVLSGYVSPLIPPSWEHRTLDAHCTVSGLGKTYGHDRSRRATADALRDRRRVEHLWRVDRSATMRPDLKAVLSRGMTLPLFGEDAR